MKEIDINNEEQILKECDFDYFYDCEKCSRELCMFFNDICKQGTSFDKKQALIDLGRIAITLNKQSQKIKELEEERKQLKLELKMFKSVNEFINGYSIEKAREVFLVLCGG